VAQLGHDPRLLRSSERRDVSRGQLAQPSGQDEARVHAALTPDEDVDEALARQAAPDVLPGSVANRQAERDPDFDFTGEQERQDKERRESEARIAEAEIEAAGPQDEPDGSARHCAFCGKHYTQVKNFITGGEEGEVGICGECIELLHEASSEDERERDK